MAIRLTRPRLGALCAGLGLLTLFSVTRAPVGASSIESRNASVSMSDDRFQPATVHVKAGETVTWRNTSKVVHTVTGAGYDSGMLAPGGSYSHTFGTPGTYDYHCTPHQSMGMTGRVVVDAR